MSNDATHQALVDAARQFNSGNYFEAHELLEDALDGVPDAHWKLYVGLIQIAVGYHKLQQELREGAAAMLERGLAKLGEFPERIAGMNLELLRRRAAADAAALRAQVWDRQEFVASPPRLQPLKSTSAA